VSLAATPFTIVQGRATRPDEEKFIEADLAEIRRQAKAN